MSTALAARPGDAIEPFTDDRFIARRNFFNFLGIKCRILNEQGGLLYFVYMKAFKLKEDITVYADEQQQLGLLSIRARQIIDFSAAYDVTDLRTGERVGAMRRRGLKSMVRDEWEFLDANDGVIGNVQEDSLFLALLRRLLANFIPQSYTFTLGGQEVGQAHGTWNPFLIKYRVDVSRDSSRSLDRRLVVAAAVLLMTIEGKQG